MVRSGAAILADHAASWGLGPVFHVPGEGILDILEAFAARQPGVRLVTARNEAGMAFMASGAARATGRASLCLAARAPGALNTTLALHTAMTDAVPLVMVIGQADMAGFERESFLDTDLHRTFAPLAKWVALVPSAGRMAEMLGRAVHVATSGRFGPVVLIVPEDVSRAEAEVADLARPVPARPGVGDVAEVAGMLARAARPLLLVGGSDWNDGDCADLDRVARALGVPVAVAYRRRDLIAEAHPCFVGEIGIGVAPDLGKAVGESDLIIAVGIRLGELNTIGGGFHGFSLLTAPAPAQALVHVHAEAGELNKVFQATVAMVASPGAFVRALGEVATAGDWDAWLGRLRGAREAWVSGGACPGAVDLPAVYRWLRGFLPADTGVAVGAGAYALWAQRYLAATGPRTLFGPKSGAMGYGLPAAIGAAVADPGRRFVALAGDGCFMMNPEELATAVLERVPVVTVVFNNNAYGAIGLTQRRMFGRAVGTGLANPDFAAMARAFGAHGETVRTTAEFAPAFERAWNCGGPAVVEVAVAAEATRPA